MKHIITSIFLLVLLIISPTTYAATPVLVDAGNGTIVDTANNLTWLKNASCSEFNTSPTPGTALWGAALSNASSLSSGKCGLSDNSKAGDWHLPTIDELRIFVDNGLRYDTLNSSGFINVQASAWGYWTATQYNTNAAYYIEMTNGSISLGSKTGSANFVWPVRTGQFLETYLKYF